jgi:serine protease
MRYRLHLLAALPALLISACTDHPIQPVQPDPMTMFSTEASRMGSTPSRTEDGTPWLAMSDAELWDYIASHDSTVVVGLKPPGAARGIWRGQFLITPAGRNAARERVQQVSGVTILQESASLPALEVKVRSLHALALLRALPVTDYVEPAVIEMTFASTKGCEYPHWSGSVGTTFAGDLMPPHYTRHAVQINQAWNRASGDGVVVSITDTGVSYYQHNLTDYFATVHSSGRWSGYESTIPGGGGTPPAWHDLCGHGTRMAGSAVAPMNGNNIAGVAWRSNLLSVRFTNNVIMPRTIATANAIQIAAAHVPIGAAADHRRIVTMAWGSESSYSHVKDQIEWRYHLNGTLFVGASGTSTWGISHVVGVVFPASMPEVIAVSAVNLHYQSSSEIHYGPQVELSFFLDQVTTGFVTPDLVQLGGSSGATAIVSGIAALVWSRYPQASRDWVRQRLRWAGHNYPYHNNTVGYGVPNAMKAVGGMYDTSVNGCVGQTDCTQDLWISGCTNEQLTAHPMGGDGPFTYTWTDGSTSSSTTKTMCANPGSVQYYSIGNTVTDTSDGTSVSKQLTFRVIDMWNPPCGGEWIC